MRFWTVDTRTHFLGGTILVSGLVVVRGVVFALIFFTLLVLLTICGVLAHQAAALAVLIHLIRRRMCVWSGWWLLSTCFESLEISF